MSAARRGPLVAWALLVVVTLVYVAWALFPDTTLYRELLTPHVLLAIASLLKSGYLLTGALLAFACRDRLDQGNPARPAWALLSAGLFATLAGQLSLAPYQLVAGETPFPSVADLFYLLAYPFLIAAFLVFLRAYHESGFSTGSLAERLAIVAVVGDRGRDRRRDHAPAGGRQRRRAPRPDAERRLPGAGPRAADAARAPAAHGTADAGQPRRRRCGRCCSWASSSWRSGDIAFAYFSMLGEQHLDPYVHATFLLSYGLVAGGAHRQLLLLKS